MILIALALFMISSIRYPERYASAFCKQMTELSIMQLLSLLMPASDDKQMLMCMVAMALIRRNVCLRSEN